MANPPLTVWADSVKIAHAMPIQFTLNARPLRSFGNEIAAFTWETQTRFDALVVCSLHRTNSNIRRANVHTFAHNIIYYSYLPHAADGQISNDRSTLINTIQYTQSDECNCK